MEADPELQRILTERRRRIGDAVSAELKDETAMCRTPTLQPSVKVRERCAKFDGSESPAESSTPSPWRVGSWEDTSSPGSDLKNTVRRRCSAFEGNDDIQDQEQSCLDDIQEGSDLDAVAGDLEAAMAPLRRCASDPPGCASASAPDQTKDDSVGGSSQSSERNSSADEEKVADSPLRPGSSLYASPLRQGSDTESGKTRMQVCDSSAAPLSLCTSNPAARRAKRSSEEFARLDPLFEEEEIAPGVAISAAGATSGFLGIGDGWCSSRSGKTSRSCTSYPSEWCNGANEDDDIIDEPARSYGWWA